MHGIDVSVIIVNYNTGELLGQCLDSIRSQTTSVTIEVIVVDNASRDDSVNIVASRYPWVRLIINTENLGFGAANNVGAKAAQGDYLLLLNSDTVLLNDAIGLFAADARHRGLTGVTGCLLCDAEGKPSNSFGVFPTPLGMLVNRLRMLFFLKDRAGHGKISGELAVDFVTGADMFLRRDLYMEIGGFDERFFMYYEETDMQRRIADKGLPNRVIEGPRIVHLVGGGGKAKIGSRILHEESMYRYFMKRGMGRSGAALFFVAYSMLGLLSIPKYSLSENRRYWAAGFRRISGIMVCRA